MTSGIENIAGIDAQTRFQVEISGYHAASSRINTVVIRKNGTALNLGVRHGFVVQGDSFQFELPCR